MASNKTQFLDLPIEIQNMIYTAVLVKSVPVRSWDSLPGIMDSCRWIRDACLPIYYLNNIFRVELRSSERVLFELWNQRLATVRKELSAIDCTEPIRFQLHVEILVGRNKWVSPVLELKDKGPSFYETFEQAYQSYKSERYVSDDLMGLRWIYLHPELKKYVLHRPKPVDLSLSLQSHATTDIAVPPTSGSADSCMPKGVLGPRRSLRTKKQSMMT